MRIKPNNKGIKKHTWVRTGQTTFRCSVCGMEKITMSPMTNAVRGYYKNNVEIKNNGCKEDQL